MSCGLILKDRLNSISGGYLTSQLRIVLFSIKGCQFSISHLLSLTESRVKHGSLHSKMITVSYFADTNPSKNIFLLEQL